MNINWSVIKLGDICKTMSGGTPSRHKNEFYNGSIPWIKSGELKDSIIKETEESISRKAIEESSAKIVPSGSLLVALYGANVGKLGLLDIDAATNQAVCSIMCGNYVSREYLFHYLRFIREEIIRSGKGGAQNNISQEIIRNLKLPLPPLKEQDRIIEKIKELFTQVDEGVKRLKEIREQVKQYRQAVLRDAFKGRLVKRKDAIKWQYQKLNEVFLIKGGGTPATKVREYWHGDIPWISSADITGIDKINIRRWITKKAVEKSTTNVVPLGSTIVVTRVGLGKVAISTESICFSQDCHALIDENDRFLKRFVLHFISEKVRDFEHQSRGTTIKGVTKKQLEDIKIPVISKEMQSKILRIIEKSFSVANDLESRTSETLLKAEKLKQSILKVAFEGKLVPQDSNDEPVEKLLDRIKMEGKYEKCKR